MSAPDLKSCPFCGSAPEADKNLGVWCDNDHCTLVGLVFSGGARHWNRRAQLEAKPAAPAAAPLQQGEADPNCKTCYGSGVFGTPGARCHCIDLVALNSRFARTAAPSEWLAIPTWRERAEAGDQEALTANGCLKLAEAEIAELRAALANTRAAAPAAEGASEIDLNEDTIDILGRPNFTCIRIAQRLRELGHEIPTRAENEQAATIHFLLNLYIKHGKGWRDAAEEGLKRASATQATKEEASD